MGCGSPVSAGTYYLMNYSINCITIEASVRLVACYGCGAGTQVLMPERHRDAEFESPKFYSRQNAKKKEA